MIYRKSDAMKAVVVMSYSGCHVLYNGYDVVNYSGFHLRITVCVISSISSDVMTQIQWTRCQI